MSVVQLLEKENKNLKEKKKKINLKIKTFTLNKRFGKLEERDKCQNKDVYLKENIC